jgi:hypothetical protein
MSIRCKVTEPYIDRALAGPFKWFVYSKNSGHIVASTYDEKMAMTILYGIENSSYYQDEYAITMMWEAPESMF